MTLFFRSDSAQESGRPETAVFEYSRRRDAQGFRQGGAGPTNSICIAIPQYRALDYGARAAFTPIWEVTDELVFDITETGAPLARRTRAARAGEGDRTTSRG